MRRTIPPAAGAVGGAGCPAGPKRAGSGGRPRRAGGRGGGPHSSLLDSLVFASGAVAYSSPDDEGEELDEAGGGGGRALRTAFARDLVIILTKYNYKSPFDSFIRMCI